MTPDSQCESTAPIRCYFTAGRLFGQYLGTAIAVTVGTSATLAIALTMPVPIGVLASLTTALSFGTWIYYVTRNDRGWIEFDGTTLRAQHLYSRAIVERNVKEIDCLQVVPLSNHGIEGIILEKLLGSIKAVIIHFRDGRTPLLVQRADPAMTNSAQLIAAVVQQMSLLGELDTEGTTAGTKSNPTLIKWKHQPPSFNPRIVWPTRWMLFGLVGTMFGALFVYWGIQEQNRRDASARPPHEISLRELIANGPGDNRHVIVKDFLAQGYAVETNHGSWSCVWVALFPNHPTAAETRKIAAVVEVRSVSDDASLQRLLAPGRITAICSAKPRSGWGATLGPELSKANGSAELSSAWDLEEMSRRPSESFIATLNYSGVGCYALALACVVFFWCSPGVRGVKSSTSAL